MGSHQQMKEAANGGGLYSLGVFDLVLFGRLRSWSQEAAKLRRPLEGLPCGDRFCARLAPAVRTHFRFTSTGEISLTACMPIRADA